jgi:hypothetical protein
MSRGTLFLVLAGLFLLSVYAGFGIGVDVEELKTGRKVEFVNFDGPVIDTFSIEEVRGIGRQLSNDLTQKGKTVGLYTNKYSIIHAFNAEEKDKLGADILVISNNTVILHIDWVRHILTGYLMNQYAYSLEDAKIISIFITYYNAVHRGEISYFSQLYQTVVTKNINSANAGIALHFQEWAGNTRLIIPLTEKSGRQGLGTIDTSVITDKEVIKELQKKEDKGIEEREKIVDVKEKSLTETKTSLDTDKADQIKAKDELKKTEEALNNEKKEIAKEEADLAKDKNNLKLMTNEDTKKEKEAEIVKKEAEITEKKEELAKKEEEVKATKEDIAEKDKNLATEDAKVSEKETEIAKDKESIERDKLITEVTKDPEKFVDEMKDLKDKTVKTEPIIENKLYYLKVKEYLTDGHYNNELYTIDMKTSQLINQVPDSRICGHEYYVMNEGVLVITHTNAHKGHFLTLLTPDTLVPKITGTDMIFHRSFIQFRGDYIYAIIWDGDKNYYLGKFDKQLKRVQQSTEKIDANTVFHLFGEQIYVNTPEKKILVLQEKDLSKQSQLDF